MTIHQQAYELIDALPEDRLEIVVRLLIYMSQGNKIKPTASPGVKADRRKAFEEMTQLREECKDYRVLDISEARKRAVKKLEDKYAG